MPQLSLYLDEPTMGNAAREVVAGASVDVEVRDGLIRESGEGRGWPSGYWG